jgi:hypothetical protein
VRSASGDTAEGVLWIEQGIRDFRATGSVLSLPYYLSLQAEALHLAGRAPEALEAINEGETLAERFEQRNSLSRLHRLRGVFLAAMGAEEAQIEASFCEAIRIAREQKSDSLAARAEATYAEYRHQKASASGGTSSDCLFVETQTPKGKFPKSKKLNSPSLRIVLHNLRFDQLCRSIDMRKLF